MRAKPDTMLSGMPDETKPPSKSPDVTMLLQAWSEGDQSALDKLTPLIYDELKRLARGYMSRERPSPTLETGALLNEAFLRLVHHHYRGWHVALLQDEDPSHTAKGSVALASEFDIELLWLPKRSPKLNPMDTLWGQGKDVVSANKQYTTIDDQVDRFIHHLESLSPGEALNTAGVFSKRFWLKSVL